MLFSQLWLLPMGNGECPSHSGWKIHRINRRVKSVWDHLLPSVHPSNLPGNDPALWIFWLYSMLGFGQDRGEWMDHSGPGTWSTEFLLGLWMEPSHLQWTVVENKLPICVIPLNSKVLWAYCYILSLLNCSTILPLGCCWVGESGSHQQADVWGGRTLCFFPAALTIPKSLGDAWDAYGPSN